MSSQVLDVKEERAVLSGPGSQDWLPRLMKKDAGPSAPLPPVQAPGPTSLGCGGRAPQPHTPVSAQPQLRISSSPYRGHRVGAGWGQVWAPWFQVAPGLR